MLAKKHRFVSNEWPDFFKQSKRYFGKYFSVFYLNKKDVQYSKIALIVPKKIVRSAVQRNQLKRCFSPLLQERKELLTEWVLFFTFNGKALEMGQNELREELERFVDKVY